MHSRRDGFCIDHIIEWNYRNGFEVIDFGIGDEGYKFDYCDVTLPLFRSSIPVNPVGAAYLRALGIKEAIRDTRVVGWVRSHIPRPRGKRR